MWHWFVPLGAGFVGEWLLVQSLVHAPPAHDPMVALTTPLAVGMAALATGLSVAATAKASGIGFLARPRSSLAAGAKEAPVSMRAGMAGACLVLAVAPGLVARSCGTPSRRCLTPQPRVHQLRRGGATARGGRFDRPSVIAAGVDPRGTGGGRAGSAALVGRPTG
ncbi:hypothetical protein [Mycobacterium tilburgii]|uniref:hypothetical protein n=1 Tax=Mycobacterium tilburgii TaxID=44467 RepID=UPI001642A8EF